MSNKVIIAKAISAILALGVSGSVIAEEKMGEPLPGMEKCYGIAKAGMNDCAAGKYKCAGESRIDGDKEAWLNVPTGLCNRIVGGTTKPPK